MIEEIKKLKWEIKVGDLKGQTFNKHHYVRVKHVNGKLLNLQNQIIEIIKKYQNPTAKLARKVAEQNRVKMGNLLDKIILKMVEQNNYLDRDELIGVCTYGKSTSN